MIVRRAVAQHLASEDVHTLFQTIISGTSAEHSPPPKIHPALKRFPVFKNFKLLTKVCQETTLYCAGRYLNLTWHVGETLNFKVFN